MRDNVLQVFFFLGGTGHLPTVSIIFQKKKEKKEKKEEEARTHAVMSTHFPCPVHVRQEHGSPNVCLRFPVNISSPRSPLLKHIKGKKH